MNPPLKVAVKPNDSNLARTARQVVRRTQAAGRRSARAVRPIAQAIGSEQPQTIAKIVVAAIASRALGGLLGFVRRRPLLAVFGVGLAAAAVIATTDAEPTD